MERINDNTHLTFLTIFVALLFSPSPGIYLNVSPLAVAPSFMDTESASPL